MHKPSLELFLDDAPEVIDRTGNRRIPPVTLTFFARSLVLESDVSTLAAQLKPEAR